MDSWKSWWSVLNVPNDGIPSSFQCLESNLPLQFTGEFGEYPLPCLVGSSRSTDPIYPLNSIIHVHACTCTCTCICMYFSEMLLFSPIKWTHILTKLQIHVHVHVYTCSTAYYCFAYTVVGIQASEHWWYVAHHTSVHGNHGAQECQERNFSTQ